MAKKEPKIISNRIKTPDGTILISRHTHDYVSYTDKITQSEYSIDGGLSYLKRGFSHRYEELSVYDTDHFELVRKSLEWGTFGKDGKQKMQYRTLCNMTNEHINAIIETQTHISEHLKKIFNKELEFRKKKNISIKD